MSATNTRREWRFTADDDPFVVPETWADGGRHEPADPGQTQLCAIEGRLGSSLQWTVSQRTGDPVRGPHRERSVFRVLYATADGQWALECEWDARRQEDGWVPESTFASVIARDLDADDLDATVVTQPGTRESYRAAVKDLYDVDIPVADGAGNNFSVDGRRSLDQRWPDADAAAEVGEPVRDGGQAVFQCDGCGDETPTHKRRRYLRPNQPDDVVEPVTDELCPRCAAGKASVRLFRADEDLGGDD